MLDIFARAHARQPLSPGERTLIRFIEGLAATAIVAMLPIVADALGRQTVNWGDVIRTAIAAGMVAVLLALSKWVKANGDPAMGAVIAQTLTSEAANLTRQYGLSDSGNRPADLLNVSGAILSTSPDATPAVSPSEPASPDAPQLPAA